MPKHKVQVTLTPYDYEAVRRTAKRNGGTLASVVREAVQEYCVKPASKEQKLRAIAEAAAAEPAEVPEDWEEWEREYSRMKSDCGISDEELLRIAGPPDEPPDAE